MRASLLLNAAIKLCWLEHVVLDGPDGAYIGAGPLGQRLGESRESIERHRRELMRLGLLVAGHRGPGKTGTYFPTLPAECVPPKRPTPAEVARLAERLDAHIRRVRSGVNGDTTRAAGDRTVDATLASPRPPRTAEIPPQSGVSPDTTKSARVEEGWSTPQPFPSEGGETQPSLPPQGGVSAYAGLREEKQRAAQGEALNPLAGGYAALVGDMDGPSLRGCCVHHPGRRVAMVYGREPLCRECADAR